jgi:multiple antibiotic resistance protein
VPELPVSKLLPLLFMMTGPLRVVPVFAGLTSKFDAASRHRLAFRTVCYAGVGVLLSVFIGVGILKGWGVSREALATSSGTLLFLTSLWGLMGWGKDASVAPPAEPHSHLAISPLAFPTLLPPFAVGVLILFGAYFPTPGEQLKIAGLALGMLVVDLVAMRYAQQIMSVLGIATLQVLGAVFGVLQLSLAIEMIFWGLKTAFSNT